MVDFCEKLGFSKKEILKNPSILRAHPSTLDQYYNVMIEGGFKVITIKGLSKYVRFCGFWTVLKSIVFEGFAPFLKKMFVH